MTHQEQPPIQVTQFSLEPSPREADLHRSLRGAEAITRKVAGWGEQQAETSETASQTSERFEQTQAILGEYQAASDALGEVVTEFSDLFARRNDLIGRAYKLRDALVESHGLLSNCLVAEDNCDEEIENARIAREAVKHDYLQSLGRQHANRNKLQDDTLELNVRLQAAYEEYPYGGGGYQTEVSQKEGELAEAQRILDGLQEQLGRARGITIEERMAIDRHIQTINDLQSEADRLGHSEEGLQARQTEIYHRMGVLAAQLQQQIPGGRRRKLGTTEPSPAAIEGPTSSLPEQRGVVEAAEPEPVTNELPTAPEQTEAAVDAVEQPVDYQLDVVNLT